MATITYERFENGLDHRIDKRASDSNRLDVLDNAHVTTGRKIRKRPGLSLVGQLEAGTKGLVAGPTQLQTFYVPSPGTITHANLLFKANSIPIPSGALLTKVTAGLVFNGFVYVAAQYADGLVRHHYLDGTVPPIVTDINCPNSLSIVKTVQKIFGPKNDVTRFCKTSNPRDWTTAADAGFLGTGLQAEGDPEAQAVVMFRKQLAVLMIDSVQVWTVDSDPTNMAIFDNVFGIGTRFAQSPVRMAGDSFFLSEQGYRSLTVSVFNENLQDVDVGSPIDELVTPTIVPGLDVISVFNQKNGQFWSITANYAWVYTVSRTAKITAWSRYTFPFAIDAACTFKGDLYLRSGNNVYLVDQDKFTDDGISIPVRVEMSYVDMKAPGIDKMVTGVDAVLKGTCSFQIRFDARDHSKITAAVELSEDTFPGEEGIPVEIQAVKLAPVITHEADELFELEVLSLHYELLK